MTAPYYADDTVTVYQGDCIRVMETLPANSVAAIVTDPPYGLGFMGKAWDDLPPGYDWAVECLRVLKPGGHLLAFGGTRTWHRLAVAVEDAGFEIRDSVAWLYGSGFPKSLDVSKAIDKTRTDHDEIDRVREWLDAARVQAGVTLGQINTHFGHATNGGGPASKWTTNQTSRAVPSAAQWEHLRELIGFGAEMDAAVARLNARKGQGSDEWNTRPAATHQGRPGMAESWRDGKGWTGTAARGGAAVRDEAQRWQGWGTALKPAFEPIVVARKPLGAGTVAANVQAWGTGALNIDGCRVGTTGGTTGTFDGARSSGVFAGNDGRIGGTPTGGVTAIAAGRWPANVVLDGSQADLLDAATGIMRDGVAVNRNRGETRPMTVAGTPSRVLHEDVGYGGSGGASRFFPTFRYQAKAPTSERPSYVDADGNKQMHATVKPLELMRWLVRLVTPTNAPTMVCSVCDKDMHGMRSGVPATTEGAGALRVGVPTGPRRTAPQDTTDAMPHLREADHREGANLLLDPVPGGSVETPPAGLSGMRRDVPAPAGRADVLLEGVRGSRDGSAGEAVRMVPDGLPAADSEESVLLPDVRDSRIGHGEAEGSVRELTRLRHGVRPDASDGDEVGLHPAAPTSDGRAPGEVADGGRGGPSQERGEDGQPGGELGSAAEAHARPDTEARTKADRVPALRGEDRSLGACAECGGALVEVIRPGVILEPFAGSGTTIEAAMLEGFRVIGIEREPDYLPLIRQRIDRAHAHLAQVATMPAPAPTLFDELDEEATA